MGSLKRLSLVAAGLVFVIMSAGRTQTRSGAPQPLGRLVDVGGYRVHLYCVGNGSPTVVITGAGYSFDWGLVQPEVAKFTRVCTYDHAGIAWSDPGPTDTCSLRVEEIRTALRKSKITAPYVLVGHSLGALVSRLYASTYPDEVVGMVIVDHALRLSGSRSSIKFQPRGSRFGEYSGTGSDFLPPPAPEGQVGGKKTPEQSQETNSSPPEATKNQSLDDIYGQIKDELRTQESAQEMNKNNVAAPPTSVAAHPDPALDFQKLPIRDYRLHLWANSLPGYSKALERTIAMAPECDSEVEAASRNQTSPLSTKPLIVVSQINSYGQAYADLQNKLLSLSLNSEQLVAENSGHLIPIDRPDVVISSIREVVAAARNHTKLGTPQ
jgi:pimeloyl-ACP methyl ester carboxylesterase